MKKRLALWAAATTFALILAIGSAFAVPQPARAGGSDLGYPSGFKLLDATTCGQYATTPAQVSTCNQNGPTWSNHWLAFGWTFAPVCETAPCQSPDGFKVVRSLNGATTVFDTVAAQPGQTTFFDVLHFTGQENIGACFFVQPYRGTNDLGRRSGPVCITENLHLPVTRWGTAHAYYYNNGFDCSSPSSNPIGYGMIFKGGANAGNELFAGYVSRSEAGCTNMYWDLYQGLIYFDLSKVAGRSISKATLQLEVVRAAYNKGDPSGTTIGAESGVSPVNCVTTIGFPTNLNVNSAPIPYPSRIYFDTFTTLNGGIGKISVDVTNMVRAWLNPGGINRGIVLSPPHLDATPFQIDSIDNAECLSQFREPTLDVEVP